jgi:hypothetical protein
MKKLFARVSVAAALAAFAVPALPCDAMKKTTASAPQEKVEKKDVKAEKKVEKKGTSTTVASADKK